MRHDGRDEAGGDGALRDGGGKVRGQLRVCLADDQGDDGQEVRRLLAHRRRRGLRLRDHLSAQTPTLHVLRGQSRDLHLEVGVV